MHTGATENKRIIEIIAGLPEANELRAIASNVTNIVFNIRGKAVFLKQIEEADANDSRIGELNRLLIDFRKKTSSILGEDIQMNDEKLYNGIIHPLVMSLVDRAI